MGNKRSRKPRLSIRLMRKKQGKNNTLHLINRSVHKVPALAVLCEKVCKKYRLFPEPKKFTPPESFSIVGGKPLRKRSAKQSTDGITEEKKKKKSRNPRSLVTLCQIVIRQHNLLPDCEETIRPSTRSPLIDTLYRKIPGKRGRPRKEITTTKEAPKKRSKGRPRKDAAGSEDKASTTVTYLNYTTFLRQSEVTRKIKVEEELNLPIETDPLIQHDEDFTVVIKEEHVDDEDDISNQEGTVQVPQATSMGITINPLASAEIPGPSGMAEVHYMTVVMDQYQVFANSIAEQLRALPSNRALLLQLDIQSMIDNEKQLIMDEN